LLWFKLCSSKKFETGDGMFFQWVLCTSIFICGFIVNLVRTDYSSGLVSSISVYPFAMLGGALWCMGNAMATTIIKCIGLGLAICLWGSVNLMIGWASGTFGLFGLTEQRSELKAPMLNYIGAGLAIVGVVVFSFVKPQEQKAIEKKPRHDSVEAKYLLTDPYRAVNEETPHQEDTFVDRLAPPKKRLLGIVLSVISGVLYGVNFNPPQYVIDHSSQKNGLDYVFSHFSGIFMMSSLIMIIYSIIMKNKPVVNRELILPGMLSGFLWSLAQISWFIANGLLGMVITFPLLGAGPGLVASLWGVLVFKEIQGTRNFIFLGSAFAIIITACMLIALSRN